MRTSDSAAIAALNSPSAHSTRVRVHTFEYTAQARQEPQSIPRVFACIKFQHIQLTIRYAEGADYDRLFGYHTDKSRIFDVQ